MCLAIPMQVLEVDGYVARCAARGIEREASLFLVQETQIEPGDFVMIHLGHVVQKISAEEAHAAWALYDQILTADA